MSRVSALAKLTRVLGAQKAEQIVRDVMSAAGVQDLDNPDQRLRFARELIQMGGVYDAIGNAIAVQAILQGAKERRTTGIVDSSDDDEKSKRLRNAG